MKFTEVKVLEIEFNEEKILEELCEEFCYEIDEKIGDYLYDVVREKYGIDKWEDEIVDTPFHYKMISCLGKMLIDKLKKEYK